MKDVLLCLKRSKIDASVFPESSFLSSSTEGYISLELSSNLPQSFIAVRSSMNLKTLVSRLTLFKPTFVNVAELSVLYLVHMTPYAMTKMYFLSTCLKQMSISSLNTLINLLWSYDLSIVQKSQNIRSMNLRCRF